MLLAVSGARGTISESSTFLHERVKRANADMSRNNYANKYASGVSMCGWFILTLQEPRDHTVQDEKVTCAKIKWYCGLICDLTCGTVTPYKTRPMLPVIKLMLFNQTLFRTAVIHFTFWWGSQSFQRHQICQAEFGWNVYEMKTTSRILIFYKVVQLLHKQALGWTISISS